MWISELYTCTQGEGPLVGTPSVLVRTSGCNLRCVAKGTLITMADFSQKPIEEIKTGDHVLGISSRGKAFPSRVSRIFRNPNNKNLVRVISGKQRLLCTPDHKIKSKVGPHQYVWKEASILSSSDSVLVYDFSFLKTRKKETLNYKKGYLVGSLAGDGSITNGQVSFGCTDKEFAETVSKYIQELFNKKGTIYKYRKTTIGKLVFDIRVRDKKLVRLIKTYSQNSSKEFFRGYVAGFFDAEGCMNSSHNLYMSQTTTKSLLTYIGKGLRREGFNTRIETVCAPHVKSNVCHLLHVKGSTLEHSRFFHWAQPKIQRKWDKLNSFKSLRSVKHAVKVSNAKLKPKVTYDITTDTSNYIAEGILVHNCGWTTKEGKTNLCDTWWTSWKTGSDKNRVELTTQHVYNAIIELATKDGDKKRKPLLSHAIISGGEPTLANTELRDLCMALMRTGFHVTIETNGTKYVEIPFNQNSLIFSISPKLKSSTPVGTEHEKLHNKNRINTVVLGALLKKYPSYLKFVVSSDDDIKEIEEIRNKINLPHHRVVLMPEGVTREQILKSGPKVHALCMKHAYRYSPREHIILFDNKRLV